MSYNRYNEFTVDGEIKKVPFIKIAENSSDKEHTYKIGVTRIDLVSEKYYKNPNYGWLILLANPELGSFEFNIESNSNIRVPFPLELALKEYKEGVMNYITYYGI